MKNTISYLLRLYRKVRTIGSRLFKSSLVSREGIVIGEGTSIGPNVCVYDHDHKFDCNGFKKDEFKMGKIIIGKNVGIAANCCILKNTQIGDNCIIGVGTVVSGVIPPNSIVRSTRELIVEKLL